MKVIAIGGEPGAGKTTLMKKLIATLGVEPKYDAFKLVPYLQKDNVYVLGKYEEGETFAGTDRMSMAVQPEAIKFLATLPEDSVVLYEGDRLFTSSFLEDCLGKYDLDIVYLSTTKNIRSKRYEERGSNQNETWLAGRESKVANILSSLVLMWNITRFENNNEDNQRVVFDEILRKVGYGQN